MEDYLQLGYFSGLPLVVQFSSNFEAPDQHGQYFIKNFAALKGLRVEECRGFLAERLETRVDSICELLVYSSIVLTSSGVFKFVLSSPFAKFLSQIEFNCREVLQVDPLHFCAGAARSFDYFQVEVVLKEMVEGDELASLSGVIDERQL